MKILTKLFLTALAFVTLTMNTNAQTEKAFQFSFITPLGTNGINSHKVANNYSVNLLGGYSRANNIFEFGGLYNINSEYTKGFQFGGLTNISAKGEDLVQFAGIANVTAKGNAKVQIGGIVNYAKNAGTQIGLINIADSISGVPVGLINIVKKNGKHELELGFSDALNTYASFKLGTDGFYTIFSGGVNYYNLKDTEIKNPIQLAVGLGFGTDIAIKSGYSTQIELLAYGLTEDKKFTQNINMLTQFKVTAAKEFASGLKVYAGPAFNLTISQNTNAMGEVVGSDIAPYTLYEYNGGNTNLKGWLGFSIGVRY